MLTRILAATVAGGIAFFILGFLIFGLVLEPTVMKPNMNPEAAKIMKDPPIWIALILGNFAAAFLSAYIFETWAGIRTFTGGLKGGAILWFLIVLYFQLMFYAFMNTTTSVTPAIADVIGSTIWGALGSGVIGAVLGMMNKSPAPTAE